jgi:glucose-6-phosphate isomerase
MLIVILKGSYIRPHRHPIPKFEIYHIVKGEIEVDIFNDDGTIKEKILLNQTNPIIRIAPLTWHSPKSLSYYSVYHEIYSGPFLKDIDVEYSKWSKEEKC